MNFMNTNISENIRKFRKTRGLTQKELAIKLGVTQRLIAHYESYVKQIPSDNLCDLAKILQVSADELLGLRSTKELMSPEEMRFWKKLKKVMEFDLRDQYAVFRLINSLHKKPKTKIKK